MIRLLKPELQSLIRSEVTILSQTQCVEELVYNSLDAGANRIAVRVNFDRGHIQVADNGKGIPDDQLRYAGERYYTSKCHKVEHLKNMHKYGYRGEALASLRDFSSSLTLESRHVDSAHCYRRTFTQGVSTATKKTTPRASPGTTVTVKGLFHNLPVRKKCIIPSAEQGNMVTRLEAISMVQPRVSFSLTNEEDGTLILQALETNSVMNSFEQLYGKELMKCMKEIRCKTSDVKVNGYVGNIPYAHRNLQLMYVNERLVLDTQLHKSVNHMLRHSDLLRPGRSNPKKKEPGTVEPDNPHRGHYGMYIININCPHADYDITFDPKKTLIEFKHWRKVMSCLDVAVKEFLVKYKFIPDKEKKIKVAPATSTNKSETTEAPKYGQTITTDIIPSARCSKTVFRQKRTLSSASTVSSHRRHRPNEQEVTPNAIQVRSPNDCASGGPLSLREGVSTPSGRRIDSTRVSDAASIDSAKSSKRKSVNNSTNPDEIVSLAPAEVDLHYPLKRHAHPTNQTRQAEKQVLRNAPKSKQNHQQRQRSNVSNQQIDRRTPTYTSPPVKLPASVPNKSLGMSNICKNIFDELYGVKSPTSTKPLESTRNTQTTVLQSESQRRQNNTFLSVESPPIRTSDTTHKPSGIREHSNSIKRIHESLGASKCEQNKDISRRKSSELTIDHINNRERQPNQPLDSAVKSSRQCDEYSSCLSTSEKQNIKFLDAAYVEKGGSDFSRKAYPTDSYPSRENEVIFGSVTFPDPKPEGSAAGRSSNYFDGTTDSKLYGLQDLGFQENKERTCVSDINYILNMDSADAKRQTKCSNSPPSAIGEIFGCYERSAIRAEPDFRSSDPRHDMKIRSPSIKKSPTPRASDSSPSVMDKIFFIERNSCHEKTKPPEQTWAIPSMGHSRKRRSPGKPIGNIASKLTRLQPDEVHTTMPRASNESHDFKWPLIQESKTEERPPISGVSSSNGIQTDWYNFVIPESIRKSGDQLHQGNIDLTSGLFETEAEKKIPDSNYFSELHPRERQSCAFLAPEDGEKEKQPTSEKNIQTDLTFQQQQSLYGHHHIASSADLNIPTTWMSYRVQAPDITFPLPVSNVPTAKDLLMKMPKVERRSDVKVHKTTISDVGCGPSNRNHISPQRVPLSNKRDCDAAEAHLPKLRSPPPTQRLPMGPQGFDINRSGQSQEKTVQPLKFKLISPVKPLKTTDRSSGSSPEVRKNETSTSVERTDSSRKPDETKAETITDGNSVKHPDPRDGDCQQDTHQPASTDPKVLEQFHLDKVAQENRNKKSGTQRLPHSHLLTTQWVRTTDMNTGKSIYLDLSTGNTSEISPWAEGTTKPCPEGENNAKINQENPSSVMFKKKNRLLVHDNQLELRKIARGKLTINPAVQGKLESLLKLHNEQINQQEQNVKWRHDSKLNESEDVDSNMTSRFLSWENPAIRYYKGPINVETASDGMTLKRFKDWKSQLQFTKQMLASMQVLCQFDNKFILCTLDQPDKKGKILAIVDQHAAHERIRLEEFVKGAQETDSRLKTTKLTKPITVDLGVNTSKYICLYQREMGRIGLKFRKSNSDEVNRIEILSVPTCIIEDEESDNEKAVPIDYLSTLLKEHLELLRVTSGACASLPAAIQRRLASKACHGAIKFGDPMTFVECKTLVEDLKKCDLPFQCAHGRPSLIPLLDLVELERVYPKQCTKVQLHKLKTSNDQV